MIDFLWRLISLNWEMLAVKICWDFKAELYRKEFEAFHDALADVFDGADCTESCYEDATKILDQIASVIGWGNPEVINASTQLIKVRALKRLKARQ